MIFYTVRRKIKIIRDKMKDFLKNHTFISFMLYNMLYIYTLYYTIFIHYILYTIIYII